ncbi:hypothetical protein [Pseudolabrys sp. FHR47]|uniref:hypothetical protein n=1 Tax=Pseudolabrys sp. FHR47 TaxID=2562284 RepID=UPI00143D0000|nr:hypothetical protein [Pseudolabrys sp. FHR47]
MVGESVSRRQEMPAEQVAESDYQSFCEALSATARGRAFLEEFARRNRQADTQVVLTALERLEATARAHSPEADRIRQDLRALLDTLRSARPQTENTPTAIKAATLAALIDFTQARIEALVLPAAAREGETLSAVPVQEQPELPIPHPTAAAPLMALVPVPLHIEPPVASAPQAFMPAQAKRKTATVIPIVEFDYRSNPNGRPMPTRSAPEESWTTLTPPAVSTPPITQPVPDIDAPDAPSQVAEAAPEARSETKSEAKIEIETYELWLDPPAVAMAEPEMSIGALVETHAPEATTVVEAVQDNAVPQAAMPDMTVTETVVAKVTMTEMARVDLATSDASAAMASPAATMSTINALMEQMEQAATPVQAVKGHAEVPDPLAPLMALSEEERIALFT